jgi:hypothetical protein
MPQAKPTTLRGYVAYHPRQGLRLDMAGRTKRQVWNQLLEPFDLELGGPWTEDEQPFTETHSSMRKFGWKVLRCTVIAEPQED